MLCRRGGKPGFGRLNGIGGGENRMGSRSWG